jgi:hypothetical protein
VDRDEDGSWEPAAQVFGEEDEGFDTPADVPMAGTSGFHAILRRAVPKEEATREPGRFWRPASDGTAPKL